ncbi:hypothetical protein [Priestia megaterium]|uniref:hypothetical protein n=1 Tax=Priestia megaterium TaxID=1404 RepID=UPI002E1C130F|nr:hypothetical protein [Priestia megaterium]MEE3895366.1 hypothetical protein [Priestia megaterium]
MDLFTTKEVFNPAISGRAIRVKGHDSNGDKIDDLFLVKAYYFDHILLTSRNGNEWTFYMDEFKNPELLTLTVLEEK